MERSNNLIRLSSRMSRLPDYLLGSISEKVKQKRRQGIDIIDLAMGNPGDPTPSNVVYTLIEMAKQPKHHRYSSSQGIFNLRREVSLKYKKRWKVEVDPETEVVCTMGIKEGFAHLCLVLLGPGDTAIVPTPAYPVHTQSIMLAGANLFGIPMNPIETLPERLSYTISFLYPKPKVLILNFPHNPTTTTVSLSFFEEVIKIAKAHNLIVVHDLAYGEIVFESKVAPSLLSVPEAKKYAVEFTSMSKSYNMPGWRIGFCVGNKEIIKGLAKLKSWYDYGIFQPIQIAAITALQECDQDLEKQVEIYKIRRETFCQGLTKIGWNPIYPKATFYVWTPIPKKFASMGSLEFSLMLLEKTQVACCPGIGFGEDGENYLRFAMVEKKERLEQAINQINKIM